MRDIEEVIFMTSSNFMKYFVYTCLIGVLLSSCEINPLFRPLAKSTAYDLVFFKTNQVKQAFTIKVTDKHLVNEMYVWYIKNEEFVEPCQTALDGEMIFKFRNTQLLKIPFSLHPTCSYVTYTLNGKKYQRQLTADGVEFLKTAREMKFVIQD